MRSIARFQGVVHGSFATTHNLKAAGSNPAPTTKKIRLIKDFKAEHYARPLSFAVYLNATSTPQQKNRNGTHKQALAGTGNATRIRARFPNPPSSAHVYSGGGLAMKDLGPGFPEWTELGQDGGLELGATKVQKAFDQIAITFFPPGGNLVSD